MVSARYAGVACGALGAISGAILGIAHGWIPLQVCLLGFCLILARTNILPRKAALHVAAFSAGFHGAAYAGFAVGVPAGEHLLAGVPMVVLVAANAAIAGAAGWLVFRLFDGGLARLVLALPAAWVGQEWLLSLGELAFPWARLGNAQAPDGPFAGLLPLGGSLLASGAMLALAGLGALAWRERRWHWPFATALAATLVASCIGLTVDWTSPTSALRVDLLQSGITSADKVDPVNTARVLRGTYDAVLASDAQWIVTSQLALPKVPAALPPGYLGELALSVSARDADAWLGIYLPEPGQPRFYNSVLAVGASGAQHYLKTQLFPFGEFIPLHGGLRDWIERGLPAPQRDLARPRAPGDALWVAGHRVAPAICYEAAFADAWRRRATNADLLVNIASDTAVETAQLVRQFRQIDQVRALELRKPLLRTSDIHGTLSIDDLGRVVDQLPEGARGVLKVSVTGRSGLTPYARLGDLPALALALMALAAALLDGLRRGAHGAAATRTPGRARWVHGAQAGQILPLSICLVLVTAGLFYLMVNAGQTITEKMRVTNAADAAAYSAAVVEARALNYDAYLNRAMVANEIVIAQMVSYGSWVEYYATASDNYHDVAADINFFILPNPEVAVLDVVFGGTEFVTHYYGETAQEYADYIVNYGIGPIITVNDAIVQLLSASEMAVQANLTAGVRQGQIANDVVQAMDPKLKAEVVLVSHGFDLFTKDYAKHGSSGDMRGRFADVTVRSRDPFTKQRNWTMDSPFDIPLLREDGALKKRAGTELIGYDEWRGIDTLELHGKRFGCGKLGISWCDDVKEPVGWGALEVDAGGGDAGHGYHGNAYGENPTTARRADENMQTPQYYMFHGMPDSRDIADTNPKDPATTGITILVSKSQADTATSGNAVAGPSGDLAVFNDHPAGGKVMALSRATVFFDRISKRADGKTELGSLYNPYWRVHLSAPTLQDRAYAATKQGGLIMPDMP